MKLFFALIFLLASLVSDKVYAQSTRAQCNFDTILQQSFLISDRFSSTPIFTNESDTGWRMGYALKANPAVGIYIGHTYTPDLSQMSQLDYLNHLDFEISQIQQVYVNQGYPNNRVLLLENHPYKWGVESNPVYNGIPYQEEYMHYQVGTDCNFIILKRIPVDFLSNELLTLINQEILSIVDLAYAYMGPVSLLKESSSPVGLIALIFGVLIPLALGGAAFVLLNKIGIFPHSVFNFNNKIFIIIPQVASYLYLIGDFLIDYLDNNRSEGFELAIFYVLALIGIMSWGILGRKLPIPISISLTSFLLSITYIIMGWGHDAIPFVFISIVALFGIVCTLFLAKFSEEEFRIQRDRRIRGLI